MKIILIGHGKLPIPPNGWGAVESVLFDISTHLFPLGHEVEILNIPHRHVFVALLLRTVRKGRVDVVWCHNERLVPTLARFYRLFGRFFVETCHSAMTDLDPDNLGKALPVRRAGRAAMHLSLNPMLSNILQSLNPKSKVMPFRLGVDVHRVRLTNAGNGRAICLGRVSARKRQRIVADAFAKAGIPIDFAGPEAADLPAADQISNLPNYLGSWTTSEVFERLTDYSALVLWSKSEVQPLVVIEALAAGLDVVVSPEALGVLDADLPFVHVANSVNELIQATERAIDLNKAHRPEIRRYAESHWDWTTVCESLSQDITRQFSL